MICRKCLVEKNDSEFYPYQIKPERMKKFKPTCKACCKLSTAEYRNRLWNKIQSGETIPCRKCKQPLTPNNYYRNTNRCSDCCKKDVALLRQSRATGDSLRIPRQCPRCKATKSGTGKNGFVAGQSLCRECSLGYQKTERRAAQYGMTKEQLIEFYASNPNCNICKTPIKRGKKFHIDHCHKTGVVRGALCNKCNVGIGLMQENPVVLQSAIDYLKKFEPNHVAS